MAQNNYGLPYMGSKSAIAEKIIEFLPEAETLVDLFGGGGAITDCASQSGKWQNVVYNEIEPVISQGFKMAIDGSFNKEKRWINRETFFKIKDKDPYAIICYSFGNNLRNYLYSPEHEKDKQAVFEKIVADPNYEIKPVETRRKWCKQYLANYKVPTIENLGRLERIKRVSQRLQGKPITVHNKDYQSVPIPKGAVIYCDIPYKDTGKYQREFDYDRFYQWAIQQDNIYISSYEMPEDKFKCVWECDKRCQFSSTNNSLVRKEKIFVPIKPTSNECKEDTNT